MTSFQGQCASLRAQLVLAPGIDRLRALGVFADWDWEIAGAILDEAGRFAEAELKPLDAVMDRMGARLEAGHVVTAPGHREAWQAFVAGGWPSLDHPVALGGQGLPATIAVACEELFNRASPAFGMLTTPTRAAAKLLQAYADPALAAEWLPKLVSAEWGATICISEAGAGSDVGRIRTVATPQPDGTWTVEGEKMWISFGDHDLTSRIGHLVLARTPGAAPGTRGLSLFLVPNRLADGTDNKVRTRRIEEKLGLHGSPTCALGFEGSRGWLVGELGRGLAQMFRMITVMRLSVASQGLGVAGGASDICFRYAAERCQGGPPEAPPLPILDHPDLQRQLFGMAARTEVLRGLVLAAAVAADAEEHESDDIAREKARALLLWLLPIVKNFGAETGFDVAAAAVLLLGGAGYTREWPLERMLRDSRVFAVYEGTTGIQALDLLQRRLWRGGASGLDLFVTKAREEIANAAGAQADRLSAVLGMLEDGRARLEAWEQMPREGEAAAVPWLNLCTLAATGWIALRLATHADNSPVGRRLAACGVFWLSDLPARAAAELAVIELGAGRLKDFDLVAAEIAA